MQPSTVGLIGGTGIEGRGIALRFAAAGLEVTVDPEQYPNGRFARLHDPEGNPVELWEPR